MLPEAAPCEVGKLGKGGQVLRTLQGPVLPSWLLARCGILCPWPHKGNSAARNDLERMMGKRQASRDTQGYSILEAIANYGYEVGRRVFSGLREQVAQRSWHHSRWRQLGGVPWRRRSVRCGDESWWQERRVLASETGRLVPKCQSQVLDFIVEPVCSWVIVSGVDKKDPMDKYIWETVFKKAKHFLLQTLSEPLFHMLTSENLCSPRGGQGMQKVPSHLKPSLIGLVLF